MQIKKDILKKISTLKNLPSLPHVLVKLISICNKDEVDIVEIAKIVEKDTALSSKIIKLVNSAYYGLPKRIESIHHSVTYLGVGAIKNIAIGASVYQAFRPPKVKSLYNMKMFWWHSLRCAILARLIAREIQYKNPEEAFLVGLLHDIGKLILWVNYPKEYSELLSKYNGRSDLLLAGEIRQGVTHCEVGAWLLQRWKLQSFMIDAVLYHHEPTRKIEDAFSLVQIVWLANSLSERTVGQSENANIDKPICGLSSVQLDKILVQTDDELADVAGLLDIEIEAPNLEQKVCLSEKDQEKQDTLTREIRDSSLLLGTLQNLLEARDTGAILREIRQGIQILFDVKDIFFFLHDPERQCLLGHPIQEDEKSLMIEDLCIPMATKSSLPVACLLQGKPLELFKQQTDFQTVLIDAQLIRFMAKDGMLCIPMQAHDEYVGVIIIGLNQTEYSHFSKQLNLLGMFSRHGALALYADRAGRGPVKKIQAGRVSASSSIARKVVHEVNNPLGIIKNYLKILAIKLSAQDIAQDEITIINNEIDRIAQILKLLTSFAENEAHHIASLHVNEILTNIVKITEDSFRENSGIRIHLDLGPSVPVIMSDENILKQVFINIIKNAAEAMTKGGHLHIKTRHISHFLNDMSACENDGPQGYVEITIKDDGPGIPDEIQLRVFDPFVTSKGGNHSGLGLSIVYNLIKTLKGTVTCNSEKGKGTCFKIGLPIKF